MNILFQLSGSISCYKSCDLISRLVKEGHKVKVVATPSSLKFVGEATLEGLVGEKVFKNTFQSGSMMSHIELSRWCDMALLCPATAQTINGLASGTLSHLIGDIFLAYPFHQKPYYIVPAMNSFMLSHPTTQKSLKTLNSFHGVFILPTEKGSLACKEEGWGRLMATDKIYERIFEKKNKAKILITGGGTQEPIDAVRVITNKSTGKTATFLAENFQKDGYDVTFLKSKAVRPSFVKREVSFTSFKDLEKSLLYELTSQKYDFVFHLAAVSDYSFPKPETKSKIKSSSDNLHLTLKKNKKLLESLKNLSPSSQIIGYKLTVGEDKKEAVGKLFSRGGVDFVVHNELSGILEDQHTFSIYENQTLSEVGRGRTKLEMYKKILEKIVNKKEATFKGEFHHDFMS